MSGALARLDALLPPDPQTPKPRAAVVQSFDPRPALPKHLERMLAEPVAEDRSGQTHALVAAAVEWGLHDGEVVGLLGSHTPTIEKYGDRLEAEVERVLGKVRPHHQHPGQPCDRAGCRNKPRWMTGADGITFPKPGNGRPGASETAPNSTGDEAAAGDEQPLSGCQPVDLEPYLDGSCQPAPAEQTEQRRTLTVVRASSIAVRPVRWLWQGRVPLGQLSLLAGREGIGKSTLAYQQAADVTCGTLPGDRHGQPASVAVAATEDSWAHTIVPRLMAAGADLERVLRVDVTTSDGAPGSLVLPADLRALEQLLRDEDVALVLLDPLMSRLEATLDSHRDAEVRQALEPLVAVADRAGAAVLGIIHVNKGGSSDPLDRVMGSRAFVAVARAVLFVMTDPDDDGLRLVGTSKNNLGRMDLPTLTFRIESAHVADTHEGAVWTGRLRWEGETARTIREAMESTAEGSEVRTATAEAGQWLEDYLMQQGGEADSKDVKAAGGKAGHSVDALKRARQRLQITSESYGFPRQTKWVLPPASQSEQTVGAAAGETSPTALTTLTALTDGPVGAVSAVGAVGVVLGAAAPTGPPDDAPDEWLAVGPPYGPAS